MDNCNLVNTIWIDKGIVIILIYYIMKYYNKLKKKIIIIKNYKYINICKILFTKLNFMTYKIHDSNNFYFNIRHIIYNQDIIIDYINNYDNFINTNKINLIPWYDMNDPLITYKYSYNKKKNKKI